MGREGEKAEVKEVKVVEAQVEGGGAASTSSAKDAASARLKEYCDSWSPASAEQGSSSDTSGGARKSQGAGNRDKTDQIRSKTSEESTEESLSESSRNIQRSSPTQSVSGSGGGSTEHGKHPSEQPSDAKSSDSGKPPSHSSGSESEVDSCGNASWVYHYRCPVDDSIEEPRPAHTRKKQKLNSQSLHPFSATEVGAENQSPSASVSGSSPETNLSTDSMSGSDPPSEANSDEDTYVDLLRCIADDDHVALKKLIATVMDLSPKLLLRFHTKFLVDEKMKRCFIARASVLHFAVACGSMTCASQIVSAWPATLMQECSILWPTAELRLATPAGLAKAIADEFGKSPTLGQQSAFFSEFNSALNALGTIAAVRLNRGDGDERSDNDVNFEEKTAELLENGEKLDAVSTFGGGYMESRVDFFRKLPCHMGFNVEYVTLDTRMYVHDKREQQQQHKFDFTIVA